MGASRMAQSQGPFPIGDTPLTDPRSVGSSALFHVLLLLLAWLGIVNVAIPVTAPSARPIQAMLEPVDNRAAEVVPVPGEGGGSPGDIGGLSKLPMTAPENRAGSAAASRDPAADALLAEILPSARL